MQRIEAIEVYNRAQRLGMRDYREKTAAGKYPYLPALDELLAKIESAPKYFSTLTRLLPSWT